MAAYSSKHMVSSASSNRSVPCQCESPFLAPSLVSPLTEATLICAQVVLVPTTQRRTVLLAGPQVRQLPRRADGRVAL